MGSGGGEPLKSTLCPPGAQRDSPTTFLPSFLPHFKPVVGLRSKGVNFASLSLGLNAHGRTMYPWGVPGSVLPQPELLGLGAGRCCFCLGEEEVGRGLQRRPMFSRVWRVLFSLLFRAVTVSEGRQGSSFSELESHRGSRGMLGAGPARAKAGFRERSILTLRPFLPPSREPL